MGENVDDQSDDETPWPFIVVQIGNERNPTFTFIDSWADGNTISYELYQTLKNVDLQETNAVFKAYTGATVKARGMCHIMLHVRELMCGDKFFVTQPLMQDVSIILGQTWQRKHNCFFNWAKKLVHYQSAKNKLWIPLRTPKEPYVVAIEEIAITTDTVPAPPIVWQEPNKSSTNKQPLTPKAIGKVLEPKQMWVHKDGHVT